MFSDNGNTLQPLPVAPVQSPATDIESLANISNGQVVYGWNDQGEKIPLGVILPNTFENGCDNYVKQEVPEEMVTEEQIDILDNALMPSVAAVEECVTSDTSLSLPKNPEPDAVKSECIKIYKRSKPKRNAGQHLKLKEMKRRPNLLLKGKQIKGQKAQKKIKSEAGKIEVGKRRQKKRIRCKDPAFTAPPCIPQGSFQSN